MTYFIEQTVNALSLGGTYALLALGLAVVFSILGMRCGKKRVGPDEIVRGLA